MEQDFAAFLCSSSPSPPTISITLEDREPSTTLILLQRSILGAYKCSVQVLKSVVWIAQCWFYVITQIDH